MIISFAATFIAYRYKINFNVDLTLISIAMIFPLVFTIRGSFRRREKALEHLSQFRSALKTVHYFLKSHKELSEEHKSELSEILLEISEKLMSHLKNSDHDTKDLDDAGKAAISAAAAQAAQSAIEVPPKTEKLDTP